MTFRFALRLLLISASSALAWGLMPLPVAMADDDIPLHMSPDELRPGMRGFGRTVMSGTDIQTFDFEVVSVMSNAWFPKRDVILVRCSGLNLEHSGIIAGMSGSPCYIVKDDGKEYMIGAVAYGWSFNKDPLCGLQPITQMLDIPDARSPKESVSANKTATDGQPVQIAAEGAKGLSIEQLIEKMYHRPIPATSRYSIFQKKATSNNVSITVDENTRPQLDPMKIPLMISGLSQRSRQFLQPKFDQYGLEPIYAGSGGASATTQPADKVKLEPGSAICVSMMRGDLQMTALGTCTAVIGDRVLGFGHSMFGEGSVQLPMATGMVHTVIPSVMRSSKLGGAIDVVGTLWGDETTGIFGMVGKTPYMVPLEVLADLADRGKSEYHYELARHRSWTADLMTTGVFESMFVYSAPPEEHHIRYDIEVQYEDLGTYRTSNVSSNDGGFSLAMDLFMPTMLMTNAPFGQAKVKKSRVEFHIEKGVHAARIDEVELAKDIYKPGETITARVRFFHERHDPQYTWQSFDIDIPEEMPDGVYQLMLGSSAANLMELRREKPYLFTVESLPQMLKALNMIGSFPQNRLYMRLESPVEGLALKRVEMPELPSFQKRILAEAGRTDVSPIKESITAQHEIDWVVEGRSSLRIKVDRKAGQ